MSCFNVLYSVHTNVNFVVSMFLKPAQPAPSACMYSVYMNSEEKNTCKSVLQPFLAWNLDLLDNINL